MQGIVLGSFYYGYIVTQVRVASTNMLIEVQIAGGWLAERFGAKRVFTVTACGAVLLTLLTPAAANVHYVALIVVRGLLGACQVCACVRTTRRTRASYRASAFRHFTLCGDDGRRRSNAVYSLDSVIRVHKSASFSRCRSRDTCATTALPVDGRQYSMCLVCAAHAHTHTL
jgi:hypothetical protein